MSFFFYEIVLELWNPLFNLYIRSLPPIRQPSTWFDKPSFLSSNCTVTLFYHPNLRWYNWYGRDIFHTVLILRHLIISKYDRTLTIYLDRYIRIDKLDFILRCILIVTGLATLLRTIISSCIIIDKLQRLAGVQPVM